MKKVTTIIAAAAMLFAASCSKTEMQTPAGGINNATGSSPGKSNANGIGSAVSAYYDSVAFTIIMVEFSPMAEATQIAHNPSINFIYQSADMLPNNQPFIRVIDAIPGDGMNPVWRVEIVTFNPGFPPRQLYSDNDVLAAAASGEISLTMTNVVYWCPVIHHHN